MTCRSWIVCLIEVISRTITISRRFNPLETWEFLLYMQLNIDLGIWKMWVDSVAIRNGNEVGIFIPALASTPYHLNLPC